MSYTCNQIRGGGDQTKKPQHPKYPQSTDQSGTESQKRAEVAQSAAPDGHLLPSSSGCGLSAACLLHWSRNELHQKTTSLILLISEVNHHCFDQLCQRWGEEKCHHWTNSSLPNQQMNAYDSVLVWFSHEGHLIVSNTVLSWMYWVPKWNSSVFSLICKQGQQLKGLAPHTTLRSLQTH